MKPGSAATPVIRTPDQRLRVFVSSTLVELADERRAVAAAISALGLTPVLFEEGARPHPPRDLYRAYLSPERHLRGPVLAELRADLTRYGDLGAGGGVRDVEGSASPSLRKGAGARSRAAPRAAFFRIGQESSYREFETSDELERLVRADLATLLSERFAAGRATASSGPAPRRPALPARRHDVARRTRAGRRRGNPPHPEPRRPAGDVDGTGGSRQVEARRGCWRARGRSLRWRYRLRSARHDRGA